MEAVQLKQVEKKCCCGIKTVTIKEATSIICENCKLPISDMANIVIATKRCCDNSMIQIATVGSWKVFSCRECRHIYEIKQEN